MKKKGNSKVTAAPTIVKQIYENAPYHPSARIALQQIEQEKGKDEVMVVFSNEAKSIVDEWMNQMLAKHPEVKHSTAQTFTSPETQRPSRFVFENLLQKIEENLN